MMRTLDFVYEPPAATGVKGKRGKKATTIVHDEIDVPAAVPSRPRGRPKKHVNDDIESQLERFRGGRSEPMAAAAADEEEMVNVIQPSGRSKKIPLKQVQEHQNLINQLNRYAASVRYRPVIEECGLQIRNLSNKSVAELKELVERVRACCANRSSSGIVHMGVLKAGAFAEVMAPQRLLKGYEKTLAEDPELEAICELIEIDSGFFSKITPIQRLGWSLMTSAATVAKRNRDEMVEAAKVNAQASSQQLLAQLIAQRQAALAAQQQPANVDIPTNSASGIAEAGEEVILQRPNIDPARGNPYSGTYQTSCQLKFISKL
jgi:hypothetical protein